MWVLFKNDLRIFGNETQNKKIKYFHGEKNDGIVNTVAQKKIQSEPDSVI